MSVGWSRTSLRRWRNGAAHTDDHDAAGLAGSLARGRSSRPGGSLPGGDVEFETPAALFGRPIERRWALVQALLGAGELSVRELSRRVERDVKRVHEDVTALTELGLIERAERRGVVCPFDDIHVDLRLSSKVA